MPRLLLVLAALALLAFAAYQYFQDYLVFSADGVRMELPGFLSFLNREKKEEPPEDEEFHLVIEQPENKAPQKSSFLSDEEQENPEETSEKEADSPLLLRAVYLPAKRLSEDGYAEEILSLYRAGLINSVVIDFKEVSGKLTYETQTEDGIAIGISEGISARTAEAAKTLSDEGLYLIGRMSACRDNTAPTVRRAWGLRTSGGATWLDRKNIRWLSLYQQEAVDYLAALALEAETLSLNELMLENLCFPYSGKLNLIKYGEETESSRWEAVERAAEKLADRDDQVLVSVKLTGEAAASGEDRAAGQRVEALAALADRVLFEGTSKEAVNGFPGCCEALKEAISGGKAVCLLSADSGKQAAEGISALRDSGFILMRENGNYSAEDFGELGEQ